MVELVMTSTKKGTEDGCVIKHFYKGSTYNMDKSLASTFLSNDWAKKTPRQNEYEKTQNKEVFIAFGAVVYSHNAEMLGEFNNFIKENVSAT